MLPFGKEVQETLSLGRSGRVTVGRRSTTVPRLTNPEPPAVRTPVREVEPISDAIVFTRRLGNRDYTIAVASPDGSSYRMIPTKHPAADAVVSPDGRRIAFCMFGTFGWRLYVADADGSDPVQICTNRAGSPCRSPAWSPDGDYIAFTCGRSLCIVRSDGSDETRFEWTDAMRDPAYSPDGRYVVVAGTDGIDEDLYILDLATGNFHKLTNLDGGVSGPAWSPDGSLIVFAWHEDGYGEARSNIYVIDADGGEPRAVTDSTDAQNIEPSWSPDGTKVVFVSDRNDLQGDEAFLPYRRFELFLVDVDGSNLTQLTDVDALHPRWAGAP